MPALSLNMVDRDKKSTDPLANAAVNVNYRIKYLEIPPASRDKNHGTVKRAKQLNLAFLSMLPMTDSGPPVKKRKKERACDACRRRKTKCDGPLMPNGLCTNCMQTRKPCTYV